MTKLIFHISILISVLFSMTAHALDVRVVGRANEELLSTKKRITQATTVGDVSVDVLEAFEVPYKGGSFGFSEIAGLGQDIDVISDTEMKAYGWCFSLDGVVPETMADQTPLSGHAGVLEWYYGFAHYKNGEWVAQCVRDLAKTDR